MKIITVKELNGYIKNKLDSDSNLYGICVRGEISNFKHHYTGHMYMSLKDEAASVKAVMFRANASALGFVPQNGMSVMAFGRVSVFERDGQYQLYIDAMSPDGVGRLYAAYEQLKTKLDAMGIFDAAHKKQIPSYPRTVGVVTAPNGAAVRDIINVISHRFPAADIKIYPALVQGIGAAESVCAGIEYFNEKNDADVLIVGRGGGSIEDLWAFNEEAVAMTIYNSKIPIISAVGHETDFTIADFAADMRAPTPSAAAELAVPSADELKSRLADSRRILLKSLDGLVRHKAVSLEALVSRRIFRETELIFEDKYRRLDSLTEELKRFYAVCLEDKHSRLKEGAYRLSALNPVNVLERGYSVATSGNKVVKSTSDVKKGSDIALRVTDGTIRCTVNGTENTALWGD